MSAYNSTIEGSAPWLGISVSGGSQRQEVPISELPLGMYLLELYENGNRVKTVKLSHY